MRSVGSGYKGVTHKHRIFSPILLQNTCKMLSVCKNDAIMIVQLSNVAERPRIVGNSNERIIIICSLCLCIGRFD